MYSERPSVIPGSVVWSAVSDGEPKRVLPDGCMDLLWDGVGLTVAGPDTVAKVHAAPAGSVMTGLRFAPGFAPRVLGMPAVEFVDARPAIGEVWRVADRLTDALATASDPGAALEALALSRWTRTSDDRLIDEVAALAAVGTPVAVVADRVGLSSRQLHRRSLDAFGYGAKALGRILRLQRALALARAGVSPADAAARAGYADQPHLARDTKALAGVPLRALLG